MDKYLVYCQALLEPQPGDPANLGTGVFKFGYGYQHVEDALETKRTDYYRNAELIYY